MENIVSVGGHINASINFAMQQNYVPVIRFLTVNNNSYELLEGIDLRVSFEPEFAKEFGYHIDSIPPHESVEIYPVKIYRHKQNTDYVIHNI